MMVNRWIYSRMPSTTWRRSKTRQLTDFSKSKRPGEAQFALQEVPTHQGETALVRVPEVEETVHEDLLVREQEEQVQEVVAPAHEVLLEQEPHQGQDSEQIIAPEEVYNYS